MKHNKRIVQHATPTLFTTDYRWLSQWGLKLASETLMRETAEQWTIKGIESEMMPFTFSVKDGEEIRSAPCVRVQDLTGCVISYLDDLYR